MAEQTAINHGDRRPAYRQVADELRINIVSGALPVGSRLPSEPQLMARFAVSRVTVRHAVKVLQGEGLVITRHGQGSFVRGAQQSVVTLFRARRAVRVRPCGCSLLGRRTHP